MNKFGDEHFVDCLEVVPSSEVDIARGEQYAECPLSEVLLF